MNSPEHIAIIGSGPSAIYLLKHLADAPDFLRRHVSAISIFEKNKVIGMGMPYNPQTTDRYNMSNISSEEVPELTTTFANWLREQDSTVLAEIHMEGVEIKDGEVYNRIALGRYLHSQCVELTKRLKSIGLEIHEYPECKVSDLMDLAGEKKVTLITENGASHQFQKVFDATGHQWEEEDDPGRGYYASPWPICKLLPNEGEFLNYPIGTLGASLSAFDVISSLAHRHGTFETNDDGMTFHPHPGAENFKLTMHASGGLLPHLQFDQDHPFREIYRHVDREGLLGLLDDKGFLRLETYFEKVCKPALKTAFAKDVMPEMVVLLDRQGFELKDFVEEMTEKHDYENAFEGMRLEMVEARRSIEGHKPVHWKEVIDDLMYTLNFHAELMPAEDHLALRSEFMPFIMNVIAAMPLPSANTLLALLEAGRLDIIEGRVSIPEDQNDDGKTTILVEHEGNESEMSYRMFIDCSGQKPLELEEYPFTSLVRNGTVRKARSPFYDPDAIDSLTPEQKDRVFHDENQWVFHTGGIDINAAYQVIGRDGRPNPRILEMAFPHSSGIRPYSYGLQACSDTSAIVVAAWIDRSTTGSVPNGEIAGMTGIYGRMEDG